MKNSVEIINDFIVKKIKECNKYKKQTFTDVNNDRC